MTINLNKTPIASTVKKAITPLVRNTKTDKALYVDYTRTINDWYAASEKTPHISAIEFSNNGKTKSSYSKRVMEDGNVFESFRILMNNKLEVLKLVKNKLGDIVAAKANYKMPLDDVNLAYTHAQATMAQCSNRLHNLKPSESKIGW